MLSLLIGLSSCDCYVAVKGKVVSSSTGMPISGVVIKMLDRNIETTSNSNGQFLIYEQTGFCFDPNLELTKQGYKPFRLKISSDSESISYEVNTKSKSVDFDKPVESRIGTWIDIYSQDFRTKGDSIIFYLNEDNLEQELETIKEKLKNQ